MSLVLLGTLAALALVDSTSFGTLLIPVWLMLAPGRLRPGRVLLFLGTVAVFYFAVGVAILFGAGFVMENFSGIFESQTVALILLLVGIVLVGWSFRLEAQAKREKAARKQQVEQAAAHQAANGGGLPDRPQPEPQPQGRLLRWRNKAVGSGGAARSGSTALVGLALAAAMLEVATMLPYLGAIGLISTSGPDLPMSGALLAAYCVVMILPALLLLFGRVVAARLVDPVLQKIDGWLTRNSTNTLSWMTGILGVLLIVNTADAALNI